MALTINPTSPVTIAAQGAGGATPTLVLQPGTVVSAQVQNVLAADLVRIAIADLSIDVATEVPLQAGQSLQLAVSQTDSGVIRLALVGQGSGTAVADVVSDTQVGAVANPSPVPAPSNDPLTPLQRIAVAVTSERAAAQQQSLAPLFADLTAVAASDRLPPALRQAVAQVLAQQTSLDPNLGGSDVQQAFQKSGLFLEASLAVGSVSAGGGLPDLKAALIALRQALVSVAGTADSPTASATQPSASGASGVAKPAAPTTASPALAPSLPADAETSEVSLPQARLALPEQVVAAAAGPLLLTEAVSNGPQTIASAMALTMLQEALPEIRRAAGGASTAATNSLEGRGDPATLRASPPPPPFRGALPSAQPVASASLSPDAPASTMAHRLLDDTDAAIARQTLLQVASLPDRVDVSGARVDLAAPRWHFEIPFATPQGTAMAQFEIARDGGGKAAEIEAEAARQVWRARFSLDIEPAGPVHALITLSGERTSVRMWAERPATAAQLRAGAGELSQALSAAELQPGDIVIREGTPPQPTPAKAGHFLDRAS
jgi:Flagellar hook-length control protein FliK